MESEGAAMPFNISDKHTRGRRHKIAVAHVDLDIPSKDRPSGLDRSDEQMQRASESGVSVPADDKRTLDGIDNAGRPVKR